jgi:hypothetical protein
MITILFLSAEPIDAPQLRVGEESRDIREVLQLGKFRDQFRLEQRHSVRAQDLIGAIQEVQPHIVHFSGHGTSNGRLGLPGRDAKIGPSANKGELCLEDRDGKMSPARPEAVAELFRVNRDTISCVLLNACNSEAQARAIAPYVGYAIGMNQPIADTAAVAFASGFYQGLADAGSIPDAFALGCANIGLKGLDGQAVPTLILGTGEPRLSVRPVAQLPVVVAVGRSEDDFKAMARDAFTAMSKYEFSLDRYAEKFNLERNDFCLHQSQWVAADPKDWSGLLKQILDLMGRLNRQIPGSKVYHFFLQAPTGLAIGLGACLGIKREVVLEHHQSGVGDWDYLTALNLSRGAHPAHGAEIVKLRVTEPLQYLSVNPAGYTQGRVYASIRLAANDPAPATRKLAERDGASFVEIKSSLPGNIPLGADWLGIARELNTVLLGITGAGESSELHLFPSVPMPLAFTMGMALDTKSPVAIHQWNPQDTTYVEIFRLNQLGPLSGQ